MKFQLTHFSKHNNLQSITYAVRSFLSLRRHPGIDFKLTSDVFRIFGGVDLFRLSVFFVVKYFSFFCQISWFTSVCFLLCFCLYWYSPKSSRAVTLFYRVAVCSVFASFAQFLPCALLLCLLSVLPNALCIFNWISDSKTPENAPILEKIYISKDSTNWKKPNLSRRNWRWYFFMIV